MDVMYDGRYEDTVLVPGQTVSAGVCLESFVVATTDKDFVPQFVDRTGKGERHSKVRAVVYRTKLVLLVIGAWFSVCENVPYSKTQPHMHQQ